MCTWHKEQITHVLLVNYLGKVLLQAIILFVHLFKEDNKQSLLGDSCYYEICLSKMVS